MIYSFVLSTFAHTYISSASGLVIKNFFEWSNPDKEQGTKINNFKNFGSAETAVPTMLLNINVCEFPPQRRSLPNLLTGFGVPVAVRAPTA